MRKLFAMLMALVLVLACAAMVTKPTVAAAATTYTVIFRDVYFSDATGAGSYAPGDTVTINAGTMPVGGRFDGWVDFTDNPSILADPSSQTTTFTMPDHNVVLMPDFYFPSCIVETFNGTMAYDSQYAGVALPPIDSSAGYAVGALGLGYTVWVQADPAPAGQHFDHWEAIDDGGQPIDLLADANSARTSFTLPQSFEGTGVSLTAVYALDDAGATTHAVIYGNLVDGTTAPISNIQHAAGDTVTLTATNPDPNVYRLFGWQWSIPLDNAGVAIPNDYDQSTLTFTMPDQDVEIYAIFQRINDHGEILDPDTGGNKSQETTTIAASTSNTTKPLTGLPGTGDSTAAISLTTLVTLLGTAATLIVRQRKRRIE